MSRFIRFSLLAGILAAPLFAVVALAQALTRDAFDLTRHPVSMLSNGNLGWIQISNFVVTGLLSLLAAYGTRAVLSGPDNGSGPDGGGGRGATWAPRLLVMIGAGMLIAAVFRLDPGDGFPAGTPLGAPTTMSWHAIVHNVGGSLSFFAMIALCFVLARRFAAEGRRTWARTGRIAALAFAALLLWAMTGGRAGALTLFVGVILAWGWIAASSGSLLRRTYGYRRGSARMPAPRAATKLNA
ncbi:DUF998 domain-containing protein [Dactylosporangium darangshiense]|uniref:DUF998 domain-containing protein n=1 Tax=Dactylosporangium darangshiense TaxID=579108 RepID=A0ABP8D8T8_9ACTN